MVYPMRRDGIFTQINFEASAKYRAKLKFPETLIREKAHQPDRWRGENGPHKEAHRRRAYPGECRKLATVRALSNPVTRHIESAMLAYNNYRVKQSAS